MNEKRYKSKKSKEIESTPVIIRQVPGDGNCLFHSLSVGLNYVEKRRHLYMKNQLLSPNWGDSDNDRENDYHDKSLFERSSSLRQIAVDMLMPTTSTVSSDDSDGHHDNHVNSQGITSEKGKKQKHVRRIQNSRKKTLFLQGNEHLTTNDLLHLAASQYDLTGDEYCKLMRNDGVWGGGPEIVALCNYLKRPIHVYELVTAHPPANTLKEQSQLRRGFLSLSKGRSFETDNDMNNNSRTRGRDDVVDNDGAHSEFNPNNRRKYISKLCEGSKPEFRLRRMACFGSPKYDYKEPIHILSADSRFPDLKPGQEASNGNHFLAIFPEKRGMFRKKPTSPLSSTKQIGFKVRSGATGTSARKEKKKSLSRKEITKDRNVKFIRLREKIKEKHMSESNANKDSLFEMFMLHRWLGKALSMIHF